MSSSCPQTPLCLNFCWNKVILTFLFNKSCKTYETFIMDFDKITFQNDTAHFPTMFWKILVRPTISPDVDNPEECCHIKNTKLTGMKLMLHLDPIGFIKFKETSSFCKIPFLTDFFPLSENVFTVWWYVYNSVVLYTLHATDTPYNISGVYGISFCIPKC